MTSPNSTDDNNSLPQNQNSAVKTPTPQELKKEIDELKEVVNVLSSGIVELALKIRVPNGRELDSIKNIINGIEETSATTGYAKKIKSHILTLMKNILVLRDFLLT